MHFAMVIVGALTIAGYASADEPTGDTPAHTSRYHPTPTLNAAQSSQVSAYESDLNSLRSSIHTNPLFTSLTAALATITAPHYGEATKTRTHYRSTHLPDWYSSLPPDLQSFISANREAKSSIQSKDLGTTTAKRHGEKTKTDGASVFDLGAPSATAHTGSTAAASTAKPAGGQSGAASASATGEKGATSEAPNPWKLAGATILTVFMAGLTAALLL